MSKVQIMKDFVNQRLTAAAEEIFELFESILAEYEEQVCRQQKLLDAVFNSEVRLYGAGKYSFARCIIRYRVHVTAGYNFKETVELII